MGQTLQDLDNIYMVTMDDKYSQMKIEYGVLIGRNVKILLTRDRIVEKLLLSCELYKTIVYFYAEYFDYIDCILVRPANELEDRSLTMISISILEGHDNDVSLTSFDKLIDGEYQTKIEYDNNAWCITYSALLKAGNYKKIPISNFKKGVKKLLNNYFDFLYSIEFEVEDEHKLLENPFVKYDDKLTVVHTEDDRYGVTAPKQNYIQGTTRKDIEKFFREVKKILKNSYDNAYKNNSSNVIVKDNEIWIYDENTENSIHIIPNPEYKLITTLYSYMD